MATKGIKLTDKSNNIYLPVTSSDLVEVNYGGQSQVLTTLLENNEQVTTAALIDLNNRLDNCVQVNSTSNFSATSSYTLTSVPQGGFISGVPMNTRNTTSGNIVTMGVLNAGSSPVVSYDATESNKQYSALRYETPLIKVCPATIVAGQTVSGVLHFSSFPAPSNSTRYMNYYDPIGNPKRKGNIFNSGARDVAYSPMIDGNNYCDVSNTTYEMYFFNTNRLRNYLTAYARIDKGMPELKDISLSTIMHWGMSNTTSGSETLTLESDSIGFKSFTWGSNPQQPQVGAIYNSSMNKIQVLSSNFISKRIANGIGQNSHNYDVRLNYSYFRMTNDSTIYAEISNIGEGVTFNQSTYATKFYETSDERLKKNITPITYNPEINIYSFIKDKNISYSYGFVAQNVAKSHPELVACSYNSSYMSVDYNSTLSLLLAQAMNKISELESRITELENKLSEK